MAGEISKSKSIANASTADVDVDVEVIFDQKVAALIVWTGLTGTLTTTIFQLQASQDGTNFSDVGSAVTPTTATGNTTIESNNFPGSRARLAYSKGAVTAGTIEINLMAAKPINRS